MKARKGQTIHLPEMLMPDVVHEYVVVEITETKVICQSTTNGLKMISIPIEEYERLGINLL